MADVRSHESPNSTPGWATETALSVLSLHGYLLMVIWPALESRSPGWAVGIAVVAALPWIAFRMSAGRPRLASWLGCGLVPFVWVGAAAVLEVLGARPAGAAEAARATVGLLAHLGATFELLRRRAPRFPIEVSDFVRTSPREPTRRARVRTAWLALVAAPLLAAVVVTPFVAVRASRFDQAFAVVAATVLGATLVLAILPPSLRREARAPAAPRRRVGSAALALAVAAGVLLVERFTRG